MGREELEEILRKAWLDGYQCGHRLPNGVTPEHVAEEQAKYIMAVLGVADEKA